MTSPAGTETPRDTPSQGDPVPPSLFADVEDDVIRAAAEDVWSQWTNELGDAVDRDERGFAGCAAQRRRQRIAQAHAGRHAPGQIGRGDLRIVFGLET